MTDNKALLARRRAAVPRGVATATPVFADRADNAELWDVEGRRYIDFGGGIAVLNVGHRHPAIMAAVSDQLERFTHTAFQVTAYDSYVELAERLNDLAPLARPAKTIFFTTGAEATENAVKIARVATGRSAVIAFAGGFHGRTLLASAMTGKVAPYKRGFGPLPGEIFHVPFPTGLAGVTDECSLAAIDAILATDVEPERVAAIIIEPVQGEGGFHVASADFLRSLRALCDRHGILLIADEVQTGFARTGRHFAIEHSDVEPDLLCVAKSLGGGFPISGVIGKAQVMDAVEPGGLGGTYGGPPVACAAALAVLDVIRDERLNERSVEIGDAIMARVRSWIDRGLPIANPRGLGAMIGFDMTDDNGNPDGALTRAVCAAALEEGLILLGCGSKGEAVRILVPLTASDEIIAEGLDMIERAIGKASGGFAG